MGRALNSDWCPTRTTSAENIAKQVMIYAPANAGEAIELLRASFSDCPLSARVAALDLLIRRTPHSRMARSHRPR